MASVARAKGAAWLAINCVGNDMSFSLFVYALCLHANGLLCACDKSCEILDRGNLNRKPLLSKSLFQRHLVGMEPLAAITETSSVAVTVTQHPLRHSRRPELKIALRVAS